MDLTTDTNTVPPEMNMAFVENIENTRMLPRTIRNGENETMNQLSFLEETIANENNFSDINMNNTAVLNLKNINGGKYRKRNKRKTRQIPRRKRKTLRGKN